MNNESTDKYIMQDNGILLTFTKNGWLHREAGPAIFWKSNTQYLNLGDEHLYTVEKTTIPKKTEDNLNSSTPARDTTQVFYMLNGSPFSKEDFDLEVKKIRAERMQNELNEELPVTSTNIKKQKI